MKYTDQLLQQIAEKGEARPDGGGQHKVADNLAKQGLIRLMPQWYKGWGQWYRDASECYVQVEGLVGNAVCWLRQGEKRYTNDIREATMFPAKEAERLARTGIRGKRTTVHRCSDIEANKEAQKLIIDFLYL